MLLQNADGSDGIFIANDYIRFDQNASEKMRLTSTGLGIGTSSPNSTLQIKAQSGIVPFNIQAVSSTNNLLQVGTIQSSAVLDLYDSSNNVDIRLNTLGDSYFNGGNVGINQVNPTEKLHVVGKGIFTDQVTIPATPVATTDAASKSYVDAQVGANDTLQEVTDNGNTTTNSIMIGSSNSPDATFHVQKNSTSYTWTPYAGTVALFEGTSSNHSILSIDKKLED